MLDMSVDGYDEYITNRLFVLWKFPTTPYQSLLIISSAYKHTQI